MEQGFKPKQEDSRTLMSSNGSSQLLPAPNLDVWTPLVFTLQKREGLWFWAPLPTL